MTLALIHLFYISGIGQTLQLTFSGIDDGTYRQLDSILVQNRTQGGDTALYWPDTVLILGGTVGLNELSAESNFRVFQNFPNPVSDMTSIPVFVPERDLVRISITDEAGRVLLKYERIVDKGMHQFSFSPSGGKLFVFNARWRDQHSSIKILGKGSHASHKTWLKYVGQQSGIPSYKVAPYLPDFLYEPGDLLLAVGYSDGLQSGILDSPESASGLTFQFATNIPCPSAPTIDYQGQVYTTVQIRSQCWMKENLNVGNMIPLGQNMEDNGAFEKYCYDDDPDNCDDFGGFYQWDEVMQYTTEEGGQGICPPGWHVPTDEEWKVLEGVMDSQFGIGDPEWDLVLNRGYDAGYNMKATTSWTGTGNGSDLLGFAALAGGHIDYTNVFSGFGEYCDWWTSTEKSNSNAYRRGLYTLYDLSFRAFLGPKTQGFNVRCVKD